MIWKRPEIELPPEGELILFADCNYVRLGTYNPGASRPWWRHDPSSESKSAPNFWCLIPELPE